MLEKSVTLVKVFDRRKIECLSSILVVLAAHANKQINKQEDETSNCCCDVAIVCST